MVKYDSKHRVDYIIRMLKGISSRDFFKTYHTNRFVFRKLWARGYFTREIKTEELEKVINYIENQIDKDGFDKRFSYI